MYGTGRACNNIGQDVNSERERERERERGFRYTRGVCIGTRARSIRAGALALRTYIHNTHIHLYTYICRRGARESDTPEGTGAL